MKLRLNYRINKPWFDDAVAQIENEHRARNKFKNALQVNLLPRLFPIPLSIEQSTTPLIANLHYKLSGITNDRTYRVLDMTCGLGLDSSYLAQSVNTKLTTIELNQRIANIALFNFKNRPNIEVICGNSIQYLEKSTEKFDLIFIDPARRDINGGRVYNIHDCTPDVTEIMPLLTSRSSRIMIKMSPMLDITQTLRELPNITSIHIIDEARECRELLAIIDINKQQTPIINVWSDNKTFSFTLNEESNASFQFSMIKPNDYLLEPSPALMKAAPFKLLCSSFNIYAIHPNTHLYISDQIHRDFPGKAYLVKEVIPYTSSEIKRLKKVKLEADIAVRNFNISAESLKNKLGIKKSGNKRLMGITAHDDKQYIIICENNQRF